MVSKEEIAYHRYHAERGKYLEPYCTLSLLNEVETLQSERDDAIARAEAAEDLANFANAIQTTDALKATETERDAARAEVATWQKVTGFDDVEQLDFFLGRNGVKNHLDVIAKLSADAWNEVARLKSLRMTLEAERDDAIERAAKSECEIEWLRAAMPRPCTNDHCVGGTHISDNGMRGRCHVCSGKGHICTTRDPNHAAKAVKP